MPQPRIEAIGLEESPLVVFDDVARDPDWLVDFVGNNCTFREPVDEYYPGLRASVPEVVVQKLYAGLEDVLRQIFGLQSLALTAIRCDFSLVTTPHAKLAINQSVPHYDSTNPFQLALLHYFCPADRGGTSFYRHRSTGFESITDDRQERFVEAIDGETRAAPPEPGYIDGDTPLFERIGSVEATYNRLAVYRSATLHSANIPQAFGFEPDVRRGRLTLNTMMVFA